MGVLGNAMKNGVIGEAMRSANRDQQTVAKVLSADESNNQCTVEYMDRDGSKVKIDKAMVDLRNKDWFPSKGDIVLIRVSGRSALVEQQYTEDYNADVRSKQKLSNDVTPDGDGTVAGSIF